MVDTEKQVREALYNVLEVLLPFVKDSGSTVATTFVRRLVAYSGLLKICFAVAAQSIFARFKVKKRVFVSSISSDGKFRKFISYLEKTRFLSSISGVILT